MIKFDLGSLINDHIWESIGLGKGVANKYRTTAEFTWLTTLF